MPTYFEYAVQLTEDNLERIAAYARRYGFEIESDLHHEIFFHAGDSSGVYVNLVWDITRGCPDQFLTMPGTTMDSLWHWTEGKRGPFQRIWKNHY